MLFGMSRATLEHTLLPIGGFEKYEVRAMAEEMKLPVFNKPDSQEICFVPNQDYAGLVRRRTPRRLPEGEFVTTDGSVVGPHEGHQQYSRWASARACGRGSGVSPYVIDIDATSIRVVLGEKEALLKRSLVAPMRSICWTMRASRRR